MADPQGRQTGDLVDELINRPQDFSLMQAIDILQSAQSGCAPIGHFGDPRKEAVRVANHNSLMCPAAQIDRISAPRDGVSSYYTIMTTLQGMYGSLSPLPTAYLASLVSMDDEEIARTESLRAFLDIFNHRIFSLLYRVDRLRLIGSRGSEQVNKSFEFALFSVFGKTYPGRVGRDSSELGSGLSLSALLMSSGRSASKFVKWLSGHFPDLQFNVEEFIPQWVRIPAGEQIRLGQENCRITDGSKESAAGATLGEWILDRNLKCRVAVGALRWKEFCGLLPGEKTFQKLCRVINAYIPDFLTYDISITLRGDQCHNLGIVLASGNQLGRSAGLFSPDVQHEDFEITLDVLAEYGATPA